MIPRLALTALVTAGFAVAAAAALNPIETRKSIMKSVGASAKVMGDMVKGAAPYDTGKAQLAMRTVFTGAAGYQFYFPEDSQKGGDTEAKPEIWKNKPDFNARVEKLASDAMAGIEPAGKGLDSLKPAFQKVAQNCQGCHEQYRVKK